MLATYGEGEPTDNCQTFYKQLDELASEHNEDRPDYSNLTYCVFGLGNKTYEHFNAFARDIDERLQRLGAKRLGARGEGDDDAK
jgi:NADPH-ferrihemoprotein reductase